MNCYRELEVKSVQILCAYYDYCLVCIHINYALAYCIPVSIPENEFFVVLAFPL